MVRMAVHRTVLFMRLSPQRLVVVVPDCFFADLSNRFTSGIPRDNPRTVRCLRRLNYAATGAKERRQTVQASHMRLLIVEDSRKLAAWLGKALQQRGYAVDLTHDGVQADSLLSTESYDGVILDLSLP